MLALNFSDQSALSRAVPGTGKSTAAAISIAQNTQKGQAYAKNGVSSLVLVPGAGLADQYAAQLSQLGIDSRVLYRTNDTELDEKQLEMMKTHSSVLISTPSRLLDYLTFDKSLVPLHNLNQLVVDELELFQTSGKRATPLEQLLRHLLEGRSPTLMILANTMKRLKFSDMEDILIAQSIKKEVLEVSTAPEPFSTRIELLRCTGEQMPLDKGYMFPDTVNQPTQVQKYAETLAKVWDGNSLVVVPDSVSVEQLGKLHPNATIIKYNDLSGLNIGLDNLLILGWQDTFELRKLVYTVNGDTPGQGPRMTIALVSDDNMLLRDIYSQWNEVASMARSGEAL